MRKQLFCLILLSSMGCHLSAENLLRGDFQPDGVGGIVDWNVTSPKMKVTRLDETGPDGMPVLRFDERTGTSCAHVGFTLLPGELYRMSVSVRTKKLGNTAGIILQDIRRLKKEVSLNIPEDTGGQWRTVEWEGRCPDCLDPMYDIRFAFGRKIPSGSYLDICNPVFEAVSEKAVAAGAKCSTNGPYVGRITPVAPELYKMDAESVKVDFYYPDRLEQMPEPYFLRVYAGKACAVAEFDVNNRAVVDLGPMEPGEFILKAELVGKLSGNILKTNEYRARAITYPKNPTPGKKLNNFVTELWTKPLVDGTDEFVLADNQCVYVCTDRLYDGVIVRIDGLPVLSDTKKGLPEAMRHLDMGRHSISVDGADGKGKISLRIVKIIGNEPIMYSLETSPRFIEYKFGHDFFDRLNLNDGFNYFVLRDKNRTRKDVAGLVDRLEMRGIPTLHCMATIFSRHPCRYKIDEYIEQVKANEPFRNNLQCSFQENAFDSELRTKYNASEVWWRINVDGKRMGCYISDGNNCQFNRPEFDTPELAAYCNTGMGDNLVCEQAYYASFPDEQSVAKKLDFIRKQALDRMTIVPTSLKHTVYVMNGWLRIGSWTRWVFPSMDMKPYYGRILQMMATDPAFETIGGVSFTPPSCDEDIWRFTHDAIRYYCIEGGTGDFGRMCRMSTFPNTVVNGDFEKGLEGWKAKGGNVEVKKLAGLGRGPQMRVKDRTPGIITSGAVGDDFAVIEDGGTVLTQKITGLRKGEYYQLQFCSFDYDQLEHNAKLDDVGHSGIVAKLCGCVKSYPEMEQVYSKTTKRSKIHGTVFTHRIVFKANAQTAVMEFSSNNLNGHNWGFNYVGVRPYYVKNDAEFETIRRLYIESQK